MDDFVNLVNRNWETTDSVVLCAWVLWQMNFIHPFINGNGRTARAAAYFVLCVKLQTWLPGTTILPELIRRNRDRYIAALKAVDASIPTGTIVIAPLHQLLVELLQEQIASVAPVHSPPATPDN